MLRACGEQLGAALTIRAARLSLGAAETPPDSPTAGTVETLPDIWGTARRREAIEGWYVAEVDLPHSPGELWVVYLPGVALNAAVVVNGTAVGSGGRFGAPLARNWNRPLFFTVPPGILRAGPNEVAVRLATTIGAPGVLAPFTLGPEHLLRPLFEQ